MFRQLAIRPYRRSSLSLPGKGSPICLPNGGGQPSSLHASVEQLESRRTMDMKKGVRIRLCFDDAGILTPQQIDQGLSKCWILVHNYILTIGQLAGHIAAKFDLQHSCRDGLSLEMDGYALPPTELASLLQNADIVSVKKQKRFDSSLLPPSSALQSRGTIPVKLKSGNTKDVGNSLCSHVHETDSPRAAVDVTPHSSIKGPLASVQQPSPSTSQNLQCAQSLQPPQAPCPPTPTQSGGVEGQGLGNGMKAPQSEEDKEDGMDGADGTDSSVLTVPGIRGSEHEILEVDDTVEKSLDTEKADTEEGNNAMDPDESSAAEKLHSVVTTTLLSDKRKFTTIYEPGVPQYKRTRIIGPHAMKSVAALRAALIGAARPKSLSKFTRVQPETKEKSVSNYPEMWARKAFDAWRTLNDHPTALSIEDLSEQSDVRPLVDMLCEFMSQLTKQNGQSYPPASIQAMLRAIGRIIRARETERTAETGIAKVPFSIYRDPRFLRVKLAVEEAVAKSAAIESAKEVMALEVHPPMNEEEMLNQCKLSKTHPEGCSRRFAYFCLRDFCVKGRTELRELSDVDFELFTDEHGECLRYTRNMGANWKLNIDNQPRHSIRCYIPDVLETYHILVAHRPVWLDIEPPPHPFFLKSLPKWSDQDVWYAKVPVGKNKFSMWNQDILASLGGLPGRVTSKFDYAKFDYMVEATRVDHSSGHTRSMELPRVERIHNRSASGELENMLVDDKYPVLIDSTNLEPSQAHADMIYDQTRLQRLSWRNSRNPVSMREAFEQAPKRGLQSSAAAREEMKSSKLTSRFESEQLKTKFWENYQLAKATFAVKQAEVREVPPSEVPRGCLFLGRTSSISQVVTKDSPNQSASANCYSLATR